MRFPGVPENIEALTGPAALSQFFTWGLDGILVMQVSFYYSAFPNDRRPIKCLVWGVFLADIVMTVLGTAFAYISLASGWGDLDAVYKIPWALVPMPVICGFIASTVQIFYCWRIWVLSQNKYIPAFLIMISVAQCTAATYCGIRLPFIADWRARAENRIGAIVWLAGSALTDFCVTTSMVFLLFQRREKASKYTESMVNRLITYTIETGLIPAVGALCQLIFYLASPSTAIHLIFFFMLAKLYSNSMMANLNARKAVFIDRPSGATASSGTAFWEDSTPHSSVRATTVSTGSTMISGSAFWEESIPHPSARAATVKKQQTDSSLFGNSVGANEDLEINITRHDAATSPLGGK